MCRGAVLAELVSRGGMQRLTGRLRERAASLTQDGVGAGTVSWVSCGALPLPGGGLRSVTWGAAPTVLTDSALSVRAGSGSFTHPFGGARAAPVDPLFP